MRYILALVALAIGGACMLAQLHFGAAARPPDPLAGAGDLVYRSGGFVLRLTQEPCDADELAASLTDRGVPPARTFRTLLPDGRWSRPGCWAKDIDGDILTLDTAGAEGFIPLGWFKREPLL